MSGGIGSGGDDGVRIGSGGAGDHAVDGSI